jgi:cob(I)alamin adenosyltransferase
VKKSSIYTRSGDAGDTALVSGTRVSKGDSRINLYGEVDELNSRLGLAIAYLRTDSQFEDQAAYLESLQSCLFDLGSNLACEAAKRSEWRLPKLSAEHITLLEKHIDKLDSELPPLKNFILPGGHLASACLHLCRTHSRSVERLMVSFESETGESLPDNALVFMNRMSDFFFVLARWVNHKCQIHEPLWRPS